MLNPSPSNTTHTSCLLMSLNKHRQYRECDENVCSCGLRWDTKEEDPHGYPEEARAMELLEEEHQNDVDTARYEINHQLKMEIEPDER